MKRLSALILILCLFSVPAFAEGIDLSAMTFEQLIALQQQINNEIMTRPESQGITLQTGIYRVGEDIPAGVYSITLADSRDTCFVGVWGYAVDDHLTNGGMLYSGLLRPSAESIGRIELRSGCVLEIGNPVILRYAGSVE